MSAPALAGRIQTGRVPFSRRLPWDAEPNSLARAVARRVEAGGTVTDLTIADPTRAGLAAPAGALASALSQPDLSRHEPSPAGLPAARDAVAELTGHMQERILLTTSTSESYSWLFQLLCDPGDAVLAPVPSYPLIEHLASLASVEPLPYPLLPGDGWRIDFGALESTLALDPRVRAILAVSPHNPTGSVITRDELARLDRLCVTRGLALIVDEVFAPYLSERIVAERHVTDIASNTRCLSFTLGGLSKSCGLPQMKVGWILIGGDGDAARAAVSRLELIADSFLSVSAPAMAALPELLRVGAGVRASIRARLSENRELARRLVPAGSELELYDASGGWYGLLRVPAVMDDTALAVRLVDEVGVLCHPGAFFDFPMGAWLVVSLLVEPRVLEAGLRAVVEVTASALRACEAADGELCGASPRAARARTIEPGASPIGPE